MDFEDLLEVNYAIDRYIKLSRREANGWY